MRYWTTFYTGGPDGWLAHGYEFTTRLTAGDMLAPGRSAGMSGKQLAGLVAAEGVHECPESTLIALVDANEDDILSLGNAVVYTSDSKVHGMSGTYEPYGVSDRVSLAVRPQDFDEVMVYMREAGFRLGLWGRDPEYKNEHFIIVRDGKFVRSLCEDCSKIIGRAAGKCAPPAEHCGKLVFTPGTRITVPPKAMYMGQKECVKCVAFSPAHPSRLSLSVSVGSPIARDAQNTSATKASRTRRARGAICKYCALSTPSYKGQTHKCNGYSTPVADNPSYYSCNGPVFASEFPEPCEEVRTLLHLRSRFLDLAEFKVLVKEYDVRGGDRQVYLNDLKWRVDPEIMFGVYEPKTDSVKMCAGRLIRGRPSWRVSYSDFVDFMQKYRSGLPTLPVEVPDTERAVCWHMLHHADRQMYAAGFGGATSVNMAYACTESDGFRFNYQFLSMDRCQILCSVSDLSDMNHRVINDIGSIACRGGTVADRQLNIAGAFDGDKQQQKELKKFMIDAAECSAMGADIPAFPLRRTVIAE